MLVSVRPPLLLPQRIVFSPARALQSLTLVLIVVESLFCEKELFESEYCVGFLFCTAKAIFCELRYVLRAELRGAHLSPTALLRQEPLGAASR